MAGGTVLYGTKKPVREFLLQRVVSDSGAITNDALNRSDNAYVDFVYIF
jgi:hypothetical protein